MHIKIINVEILKWPIIWNRGNTTIWLNSSFVSGRMQGGPRMEESMIRYSTKVVFWIGARSSVGVKLNVQVCESDQMSARLPPVPAVSQARSGSYARPASLMHACTNLLRILKSRPVTWLADRAFFILQWLDCWNACRRSSLSSYSQENVHTTTLYTDPALSISNKLLIPHTLNILSLHY